MSEIEIIRYVYINLGRKMNFDLGYTFGNGKQRDIIYHRAIDEKALNEVFEKRTAICKDMAYLMVIVLQEFGIKVTVEQSSDYLQSRHVYNKVHLKDGRKVMDIFFFIMILLENMKKLQWKS